MDIAWRREMGKDDSKKAHGYHMHICQILLKWLIIPSWRLKIPEVSSLSTKNYALNKLNYRPIGLVIALSKIYENASSIQVEDHFNSILSASPSPFRKRYNCESTLLNMNFEFWMCFGWGEYVASTTINISKAVDYLFTSLFNNM